MSPIKSKSSSKLIANWQLQIVDRWVPILLILLIHTNLIWMHMSYMVSIWKQMLTDSSGINSVKHRYRLADNVSPSTGWSAAMTSWSIMWPYCESAWNSSDAARALQRSRSAIWSGTGRTQTCGMPPCRGRWSSSSRCTASATEEGEGEEEGACDQDMKEVEMCRNLVYAGTGDSGNSIIWSKKWWELNGLAPCCLRWGTWGLQVSLQIDCFFPTQDIKEWLRLLAN